MTTTVTSLTTMPTDPIRHAQRWADAADALRAQLVRVAQPVAQAISDAADGAVVRGISVATPHEDGIAARAFDLDVHARYAQLASRLTGLLEYLDASLQQMQDDLMPPAIAAPTFAGYFLAEATAITTNPMMPTRIRLTPDRDVVVCEDAVYGAAQPIREAWHMLLAGIQADREAQPPYEGMTPEEDRESRRISQQYAPMLEEVLALPALALLSDAERQRAADAFVAAAVVLGLVSIAPAVEEQSQFDAEQASVFPFLIPSNALLGALPGTSNA